MHWPNDSRYGNSDGRHRPNNGEQGHCSLRDAELTYETDVCRNYPIAVRDSEDMQFGGGTS